MQWRQDAATGSGPLESRDDDVSEAAAMIGCYTVRCLAASLSRRHTLSFRTTRTQQSFIASLLDFEVCCLQYKTTGKSTWVGQLRACGVQAQVGLHLRNVQCQLRATLSREVFVSGCLLLLRRYDFSYRTMLYIARTMLLQDVRPSGGVECKGIWKNHDFRPISRFIS